MGEQGRTGKLTALELLLIKTIVIYCILQGFETSLESVYDLYMKSYHLAQSCDTVEFPVYSSDIQIIRFVFYKVFQQMDLVLKLFNYNH